MFSYVFLWCGSSINDAHRITQNQRFGRRLFPEIRDPWSREKSLQKSWPACLVTFKIIYESAIVIPCLACDLAIYCLQISFKWFNFNMSKLDIGVIGVVVCLGIIGMEMNCWTTSSLASAFVAKRRPGQFGDRILYNTRPCQCWRAPLLLSIPH